MYELIIIWNFQVGKTFCASLIAGSRWAFLCVDCLCLSLREFWPRLNEMHELQSFAPCKAFLFNMFFFFASLENYFGFRITKGKGKMDHSVSQRQNKKFWTLPKGQVFFWLCIRIICKWILCAVFHLNSFTGLNYNPLVFSYK